MQPEVVVVNSVDLTTWRAIHADLEARGLPSVLYLREETGLLHLSHSGLPPDLLLSNARSHARAAKELGHEAVVVPSIVDTSRALVASTRERVVLVNPIPSYGLETALGLATARPSIPFTLVESWPLSDSDLGELEARIAALGNVELQRFTADPARVYERARILLAPYDAANRPRVVAEAQANGIPVLATDRPGLAEAVGPGGVLVGPDEPLEKWIDALDRLWGDADDYERFVVLARDHAAREEMRPDTVVERFEAELYRLTSGRRGADVAFEAAVAETRSA